MSYDFTPMSDEELEAMDIVPEGVYDFQVTKSKRQVSKKGNPMCALQLQVWDNAGGTHTVFDYLVFSQVNMNIRKISHFCKSVGLIEEYKRGQIPEELDNYCGRVSIGVQEPMPNPAGGFYPKKNVVLDYIVGKTDTKKIENTASKEHAELEFNDDVPF